MKTAITPTRAANFPEWFQQIIKAAELADNAPVRGCMIMRPWGYGLWERLQGELDKKIKETGHDNVYFPLFIPLRFLEKEAAHVEGFAKEMAVVTHHRLRAENGKLVPDGELEEPLVVRPTSETIIGESFAHWIESWRDLPILINQWANVVRWEMRPRLFLRTTEFLWQEGHTAHATQQEAMEETKTMLEVYRQLAEDFMAIPVIAGEKPPSERFPGADNTYTIEAMMQDGKALQAGTSHFLGQNFAHAAGIRFQDKDGQLQHAWTTSWGVSTRLLGAMIMTHGDDNGLQLPPRIAPKQIIILPILRGGDDDNNTIAYAKTLEKQLQALNFAGEPVRLKIDLRDKPNADKKWEWIKKGVPLILEVGPRDIASQQAVLLRRDQLDKKQFATIADLTAQIPTLLQEIQTGLFQRAAAYRDQKLVDITDKAALLEFFKQEQPSFARIFWAGDETHLAELNAMGVTIRCLPLAQPTQGGACIFTGATGQHTILAKAY